MTNKEVVINFLNGKNAHSLNMRSENGRLYSYSTCIAEFIINGLGKKTLLINKTKYSVTTSAKHQRPLYDNLWLVNCEIVECKNIPQGRFSLTFKDGVPMGVEL